MFSSRGRKAADPAAAQEPPPACSAACTRSWVLAVQRVRLSGVFHSAHTDNAPCLCWGKWPALILIAVLISAMHMQRKKAAARAAASFSLALSSFQSPPSLPVLTLLMLFNWPHPGGGDSAAVTQDSSWGALALLAAARRPHPGFPATPALSGALGPGPLRDGRPWAGPRCAEDGGVCVDTISSRRPPLPQRTDLGGADGGLMVAPPGFQNHQHL